MVPSSITGRNESCCARLKRCTSSTNSNVPLPVSRRSARGVERPFSGRRRRKTPPRSARNAGRSPAPAAAPPWSCRCRADPRISASPASGRQHARQRAVGAEQMILPHHFRQRARAKPVGSGRGASLLHPGGGEQTRPASLWRAGSSAERDVDLLAAAHEDDAPGPVRLLGVALSRSLVFCDFLLLTCSMMSPFWKPTLRAVEPSSTIENHDAFGIDIAQMQFVGHRGRQCWQPWRPGTASANGHGRSHRAAVSGAVCKAALVSFVGFAVPLHADFCRAAERTVAKR
jgi:hypothetical protein